MEEEEEAEAAVVDAAAADEEAAAVDDDDASADASFARGLRPGFLRAATSASESLDDDDELPDDESDESELSPELELLLLLLRLLEDDEFAFLELDRPRFFFATPAGAPLLVDDFEGEDSRRRLCVADPALLCVARNTCRSLDLSLARAAIAA